jgi:hypothetical protein
VRPISSSFRLIACTTSSAPLIADDANGSVTPRHRRVMAYMRLPVAGILGGSVLVIEGVVCSIAHQRVNCALSPIALPVRDGRDQLASKRVEAAPGQCRRGAPIGGASLKVRDLQAIFRSETDRDLLAIRGIGSFRSLRYRRGSLHPTNYPADCPTGWSISKIVRRAIKVSTAQEALQSLRYPAARFASLSAGDDRKVFVVGNAGFGYSLNQLGAVGGLFRAALNFPPRA